MNNDAKSIAIPRLVGTPDLQELKLGREEAFLLFRVDGSTSLDQLVAASGLPPEDARKIFEGLREKGLITFDSQAAGQEKKSAGDSAGAGEPSQPPGEAQEAPPWEGMTFDPFELREDVGFDEYTKKKIIYLHQKMEELTHYQILEIPRRSDQKTIKRAYFNVSRNYHPDSYFRMNLGSYRAKVEDIFKRVTRAYEVLADEDKRRAYDATLPYEPTPEEIEVKKREDRLRNRDVELKEERRQRLLRRSPLTRRRIQAAVHHQDALAFKGKNDPLRAANCIRLALSLDPQNEEYLAFLREVEPKAGELRADTEFKRARFEESVGKPEEALRSYLRVIEGNPNDARALHRAAQLLLDQRRDLRQAVTFCRKAMEQDSGNAEIVATLAQLYFALGMNKNALREYARLAELKPLDEDVRQKLKELKKAAK